MAKQYLAAVAAVAALSTLVTGPAYAYEGSGASRYQRVSDGPEGCEYAGFGEPDPSYYAPGNPSKLITCTEYDFYLLGCYEGFLDDCDALRKEVVGEFDDGSVGEGVGNYGWSCGQRLRYRDDWPINSPARSCHEIDWSHG